MNNNPLVTIVAINYNSSRFVIETLESIKNQTYSNIELVVIDDCSTDDSVEKIKTWLQNYQKPYKIIIHSQNLGISETGNDAIANATGKYFSFLPTDDVIMPDKISDQVNLFESSKEDVALVYGDCMMINENGECKQRSIFESIRGKNFKAPSGKIFKNIADGFYFFSQASLISLEKLKKINFSFKKELISEDWDMQLALARQYDIIGSNKICTKYRRSDASFTSLNWKNENYHVILRSHFKMLKKYYSHPQNTQEDNSLILHKLREIYASLYHSMNSTIKDKCFYGFTVLRLSKSFNDFICSLKTFKRNWLTPKSSTVSIG